MKFATEINRNIIYSLNHIFVTMRDTCIVLLFIAIDMSNSGMWRVAYTAVCAHTHLAKNPFESL